MSEGERGDTKGWVTRCLHMFWNADGDFPPKEMHFSDISLLLPGNEQSLLCARFVLHMNLTRISEY